MPETPQNTEQPVSPETQALQAELNNLQQSIESCRATIIKAQSQAVEIGQQVSMLSAIDTAYQGDERVKQQSRLFNVLKSGKTTIGSLFSSLGGKVTPQAIEQKVAEVESQSQTPEAKAFREGKSTQELQEQRAHGTHRTYGDTAKSIVTDEEHIKPEGYAAKYKGDRDQYQEAQQLKPAREQLQRDSDVKQTEKQSTLTGRVRDTLSYQEQQTLDALMASKSVTAANFTDAKGNVLPTEQIKQKLHEYEQKHVTDMRTLAPTLKNVPTYAAPPVPAWRDPTIESNVPERFRLIPDEKGVLVKPPLPEDEELRQQEENNNVRKIVEGLNNTTQEQRTKILDRVKADLAALSPEEQQKQVKEIETVLDQSGLLSPNELLDGHGNPLSYNQMKAVIKERGEQRATERKLQVQEAKEQSIDATIPKKLTEEEKAEITQSPTIQQPMPGKDEASKPLDVLSQILDPQLRADVETYITDPNTLLEHGKLKPVEEIQSIVEPLKSEKQRMETERENNKRLAEDLKKEAPDFYAKILDLSLREKIRSYIDSGAMKMEDVTANLINGHDAEGKEIKNGMPQHPLPKSPEELQVLINKIETQRAHTESTAPAYYDLILDTSTRDMARKLVEGGVIPAEEVFDPSGKPISSQELRQKLLPQYTASFPAEYRDRITVFIANHLANFNDFVKDGTPITNPAELDAKLNQLEEAAKPTPPTPAATAPTAPPPPAKSAGLFGQLRNRAGQLGFRIGK